MLAIPFKESHSYYSIIDLHATLMLLKTTFFFFPSLNKELGGKTMPRIFWCLPSNVLFLSELRPYGHIKPKLGGSEV